MCSYKDPGTNGKELPLAKSGTVWASKEKMIVIIIYLIK